MKGLKFNNIVVLDNNFIIECLSFFKKKMILF